MQRIILWTCNLNTHGEETVVLTYEEFDSLTPSQKHKTAFQFGYFLNEDDLLEARKESYQNGFQEGMKWCIEKLPTLRKFSDEQVADMLKNIKEKVVI